MIARLVDRLRSAHPFLGTALASLAVAAASPAGAQSGPGGAFATAAIPRSAMPPVRGQLFNEKALTPFLRKLGMAAHTPVHIVQIGDSHTAGDLFSGGWRNLWQLQYGPGGRGMMAVGRPSSVYVTQGITARQSSGWTVSALLGANATRSNTLLGMSGFTQTAARAGATLGLSTDSSAYDFDSLSVCALTGPDMGTIQVTLGSIETSFSLATPEPDVACFETRAPDLQSTASIKTLDEKPVSLTSWTTRRGSNGIILSNLGVVSARLQHWKRLSDAVLAKELQLARPDLVVLAFGTNEGFFAGLSLQQEADTLREQVQRIRGLLGYPVPILLLGPPDVTTARADLAAPMLPETTSCPNGRFVPGNIARMRSLQKRLAADLNLGFWDWQGAMGGPCASIIWTAQGLQRGDFIHFNPSGGLMLGQSLAADLDDARLRVGGN